MRSYVGFEFLSNVFHFSTREPRMVLVATSSAQNAKRCSKQRQPCTTIYSLTKVNNYFLKLNMLLRLLNSLTLAFWFPILVITLKN